MKKPGIKSISFAAGAAAVAAGAVLLVPSVGSAAATYTLSANGLTVTAAITGLADQQGCALIAWPGSTFDPVDLDSPEKVTTHEEQSLTTPAPSFTVSEEGAATLTMDFSGGPGAGTYVFVLGCNSLTDASTGVFAVEELTLTNPPTGSSGSLENLFGS